MTKPSPSTARDCGRSVERLIRHLVERIRPLQEPLQDRGRSVAHRPCPPCRGRRALRLSVYPNRGRSGKKTRRRYPSGRLPPGEEVRGKAASGFEMRGARSRPSRIATDHPLGLFS
jgi:hypothetical protein